MASLNYYITNLSSDYFISHGSSERTKINNSIEALKKNLKSEFGNDIKEIKIFGSFKRDTILPGRIDYNSDVDVMIIFDHERLKYTPETYRNQLKRFAENKYNRSETVKDFPTVRIDLSHITLDLIPTKVEKYFFSDSYSIPDKNNNWMLTDPDGFNDKLTQVNSNNNSIVKPIIRLLKAWNCNNSYPFESFKLEVIIADKNFYNENIETGFYYVGKNLPTYNLTSNGEQKVKTLATSIDWVKEYLRREDIDSAKMWLHKILPY
ncbi:hypothetical protein BH11BAC1_BH11BAC1_10320 [soil metagenome]